VRRIILIPALALALAASCWVNSRTVTLQGARVFVSVSKAGEYALAGRTIEACTLAIGGQATAIPAGTVFEADGEGNLSSLTFPTPTVIHIGVNDIAFEAHEYVSLTPGLGVRYGIPAHRMTLEAGRRRIPFAAMRLAPDCRAARGEALMHFHGNGAIADGLLDSAGVELQVGANRVALPGDNIISFDEDGAVERVWPRDSSALTVGRNRVVFKTWGSDVGEWGLYFYPTGSVKSGYLPGPQTLLVGSRRVAFTDSSDGSRASPFTGHIGFHPNGEVARGMLADTTAFDLVGRRIRLLPSQTVLFDSSGALVFRLDDGFMDYRSVDPIFEFTDEPPDETDPGGDAAAKAPPRRWPAGLFDGQELARDTTLTLGSNTLPCRARGTRVWSEDEGGGLWAAALQRDVTLWVGPNRVAFVAGDTDDATDDARVSFYRNGCISGGPTRQDQALTVGPNRIRFWKLAPQNGNGQLFYDNGEITGGLLYSDTRLKVGSRSILFKATRACPAWRSDEYADICFHRDGSVAYGYIAEPLVATIGAREAARVAYGAPSVTLGPGQKVQFRRDGRVLLQNSAFGLMEYTLLRRGDGAAAPPCVETE
jgi:hypothetical protein